MSISTEIWRIVVHFFIKMIVFPPDFLILKFKSMNSIDMNWIKSNVIKYFDLVNINFNSILTLLMTASGCFNNIIKSWVNHLMGCWTIRCGVTGIRNPTSTAAEADYSGGLASATCNASHPLRNWWFVATYTNPTYPTNPTNPSNVLITLISKSQPESIFFNQIISFVNCFRSIQN